MKELSIEKMEINNGNGIGLWEGAGLACGSALSGAAFGGFGLFVSAAIFGPTCVGLVIGAALNN